FDYTIVIVIYYTQSFFFFFFFQAEDGIRDKLVTGVQTCALPIFAIKAINSIRLDQYILKPWDPPEEKLYPVLDDLLSDWVADFRPPFEGLRLLARRWSPRGHDIRDYLTRNQVPYAWLDPEADEEGRRL